MRATAILIAVLALDEPAAAQGARPGNSPPAGWTLALGFGAGLNSNPQELTTRTKGDVFLSPDIGLSYRQPLWADAALGIFINSSTDRFGREHKSGSIRGNISASLSQGWQGWTIAATVSHRKTMEYDFSRHEGASSETGINLSRIQPIAEGWSLFLFSRIARRFVNDGTEDQFRAAANATLLYKTGLWSFRLGGGFNYVLEDKTPILPRINDRSVSVRAGISYEWAKDRELTLGASYTRTYSSYQPDRTKIFTLQPRVAATMRF